MNSGQRLLVVFFIAGCLLILGSRFIKVKPTSFPPQFIQGEVLTQLITRSKVIVLDQQCQFNPCRYVVRLPDNSTITLEEFELRRDPKPTKE